MIMDICRQLTDLRSREIDNLLRRQKSQTTNPFEIASNVSLSTVAVAALLSEFARVPMGSGCQSTRRATAERQEQELL